MLWFLVKSNFIAALCPGGETGYHYGLRNHHSGFEFRLGYKLRTVKYFYSTMGVHLGINHRRNTGSNPA